MAESERGGGLVAGRAGLLEVGDGAFVAGLRLVERAVLPLGLGERQASVARALYLAKLAEARFGAGQRLSGALDAARRQRFLPGAQRLLRLGLFGFLCHVLSHNLCSPCALLGACAPTLHNTARAREASKRIAWRG